MTNDELSALAEDRTERAAMYPLSANVKEWKLVAELASEVCRLRAALEEIDRLDGGSSDLCDAQNITGRALHLNQQRTQQEKP